MTERFLTPNAKTVFFKAILKFYPDNQFFNFVIFHNTQLKFALVYNTRKESLLNWNGIQYEYPVSSVVKHILIGAGGLGFDSQARLN